MLGWRRGGFQTRPYNPVLRRQHLIQFLQHPPQLFPKQLIHLADPAVLLERRKLEIIPTDLQAGYDMVAYPLQPPALLVTETLPAGLLFCNPDGKTLVNMLLERLQYRLLMQGKTDQRDDISPELLPTPLALSRASASNPASMTSSALTVSIIWSALR